MLVDRELPNGFYVKSEEYKFCGFTFKVSPFIPKNEAWHLVNNEWRRIKIDCGA